MTQYGTWVSYGGTARVGLAIVLLAAAAGLAYAGTRLPLPARAARPSRAAAIFMILTWVLAIATFLVCVAVYVQQERLGQIAKAAPADPITPVPSSGQAPPSSSSSSAAVRTALGQGWQVPRPAPWPHR